MDTNKSSSTTNRDPTTGEPGSHPVGTTAGAAAGGTAGAAIGAVGGSVGVGVGASSGAVIDGLTGHAAGEQFNSTTASDLGSYIDYKVVDMANEKIGTVDAVWQDHTGQPSYLAIRSGWLGLGKAHVVPAHRAQVDERNRQIRLPFSEEMVKAAPTFDRADEITEQAEGRIREYFGEGTLSQPDHNEPYVDTPHTAAATPTDEETTLRLKTEELKVGNREVE